MRLLVVAPSQDGISTDAELPRVIQGHEVWTVDGTVDRQKIEMALGQRQYEAVHFMQHGGVRVLQYADGLMEAGELVAMLRRQHGLQFVALNACDSIAVGVEIHNALDIPVVVHNAPVEDKAAVRFSEQFYRLLAAGQPLGEAVRGAVGVLTRLFPNQAAIPQLVNGNMAPVSAVRRLDDCLAGVRSDIDGLAVEMRSSFERFDGRLERVEATVNKNSHTWARAQLVLLALLLLAQLATTMVNATR